VTLLNINENMRFKEGAVRFLGCLPIYDHDASLLGSEAKKRSRSLELYHDCCTILSANILEFCEQRHTMLGSDGHNYVVVPRLAFVAADFQQIQQNLALVGHGCHVCECPHDELDCTDTQWPLRDTHQMMEAMYLLADEVLGTDGKVMYGKKKRIEEWEKLWGVKFMENGFSSLIRVGLDPHVCNPRDLLHHLTLGLYGEHIANSTVCKLIFADTGLGNPVFWAGARAPIDDKKVKAIWTSMALRLANIREEDAGFTISSKMSKHFLKVPTLNSNCKVPHLIVNPDIEYSGL
jgi:hypothetical protein